MKLSGTGIAVFCGSQLGTLPGYRDGAAQVGSEIACRNATLVYGGGSVGLMGVVADAALAAGGRVIGVIPRMLSSAEIAHQKLTEMIVVESMHERKAIMSARCGAYVILPGGFGTYDELIEVVTWKQLGLHDKPIVVLNPGNFFGGLLAQTEHAIMQGFIRAEYRSLMSVVGTAAEAIRVLEQHPEPRNSHDELT